MDGYEPNSDGNVDIRLPCLRVAATTGGRYVVAKLEAVSPDDLVEALADSWKLLSENSRERLRELLED